MQEYKWCIVEVRATLLDHGWNIQQEIEPHLKGYNFRKWIIEKEGHTYTLEFYHVRPFLFEARYASDCTTYACKIRGTDVSLTFLEYYQKAVWMQALQSFVEALNFNFNLVDFGGRAIEEMRPNDAIDIAKRHIDSQGDMNAQIIDLCWSPGWKDGNFNVDHQVWIVSAENLNPSRFEGSDRFSIIINTKTKQVEEVTSS